MDPTQWQAPWAVVLGALFVIVLARAGATYLVGRWLAARTTRSRWHAVAESPGFARATGWLDRWGAPAVAVSFLTIGFQTVMNLAAGVARMPLLLYLPALLVGGAAWALIYSTVGFVGFAALSRLWSASPWAVAVLVAALAAIIVWTVVGGRRGRD